MPNDLTPLTDGAAESPPESNAKAEFQEHLLRLVKALVAKALEPVSAETTTRLAELAQGIALLTETNNELVRGQLAAGLQTAEATLAACVATVKMDVAAVIDRQHERLALTEAQIRATVAERLASLRDGTPGKDAVLSEEVVERAVAGQMAPVHSALGGLVEAGRSAAAMLKTLQETDVRAVLGDLFDKEMATVTGRVETLVAESVAPFHAVKAEWEDTRREFAALIVAREQAQAVIRALQETDVRAVLADLLDKATAKTAAETAERIEQVVAESLVPFHGVKADWAAMRAALEALVEDGTAAEVALKTLQETDVRAVLGDILEKEMEFATGQVEILIAESVAPFNAAVAEIRAQIAALPVPVPAKDGDPGKPGKDADMGEVRVLVATAIAPLREEIARQAGEVAGRLANVRGGEPGKPGEPGPPGPPGEPPVVRFYEAGRSYPSGAWVRSNGGVWQARLDTTGIPSEGGDWVCVVRGIAGAQLDEKDGETFLTLTLSDKSCVTLPANLRGPEGDGMRFKGVWQATAPGAKGYDKGDVVARDGGSFVALKSDPGDCPGVDWGSLALRGKAGGPGKDGDVRVASALVLAELKRRDELTLHQLDLMMANQPVEEVTPQAAIFARQALWFRQIAAEEAAKIPVPFFAGAFAHAGMFTRSAIVNFGGDLYIAREDVPRGVAPNHRETGERYWQLMFRRETGPLPRLGPTSTEGIES